MTTPFLLTIGSVAIVSLVSLGGIFVIGLREREVQRKIFVILSFAVGALLGDVFIHIVPELAEAGDEFLPTASLLILAGILISFVIEKGIHWHHHCHDPECVTHPHPVGLVAIVGDAMHNIVDGILIAGSYLIDLPTGVATTVAVLLHEIPQEISDYAILLHSGYSRGRALFLNFVTALTALAGAVAVLALHASLPDLGLYLLPLVAGNFLYIAVADLLPELHKQTRIVHSASQFAGVLAGIGLMFLLTFLE